MHLGPRWRSALHRSDTLPRYAYHDQEGIQHLWFVQDDHGSNRHLTDTEQGTTAAFPEVTGDGTVLIDLENVDLGTVVTAQQARSIGISPATAAKLSAFLQWALGRYAVAKAKHTGDPNAGYGTELRGYRRLALIALDVAHGRLPLAALAWHRAPLCDGIERLFTSDEVEQAQPH